MRERTASRLKLVGIGLAALAPVAASYLLYWFWTPQQHANHGELVAATPVPVVRTSLSDGTPFSFAQLRGRWVLVAIDSGACSRACEDKLWLMRQVRKAQGTEAERVERVWLIEDGIEPRAALLSDYAGTWPVRAAGSALLQAFPALRSPRTHIYLIDPAGNVMMRFPESPDARRMIKDLARLLKYARG